MRFAKPAAPALPPSQSISLQAWPGFDAISFRPHSMILCFAKQQEADMPRQKTTARQKEGSLRGALYTNRIAQIKFNL